MSRSEALRRADTKPTISGEQIGLGIWFYGSMGLAVLVASPRAVGGLFHDYPWLRLGVGVLLLAMLVGGIIVHRRRVRAWTVRDARRRARKRLARDSAPSPAR